MEDVKRKTRELEASVLSLANGTGNAHIWDLFNQFQKAVAASPSAAESQISLEGLETTIKEADSENCEDYIDSCKDEPLSEEEVEADQDGHVDQDDDTDQSQEGADSNMRCKLCEVNHSIASEQHDIHGCYEESADMTEGNMESFSHWTQLSEHVQDEHCKFDDSRVARDGLTLDGTQLVNSSGETVRAKRTLMKYHVMMCPRCTLVVKIVSTYKDGYMKMCHHLNTKHKDTIPDYMVIYECDSCKYTSYSEKLYACHMEYNHSGRKNKANQKVCCNICGKHVLQRFLARHLVAKHDITTSHAKPPAVPDKVKCKYCSKEISGTTSMNRHVERVHHKVRNYLCHICSKDFYENKELVHHVYQKHQINIQNWEVLQCQVEGCDFTSLSNDLLSRHVTTKHGGDKQFVCSHCGKAFKTIHNLKQHELVMHTTTSARFDCQKCPFRSHSEHYLKRHMKIHQEIRKHKCEFPGCTYQSHFSENVRKHSKRMHSADYLSKRKAKSDHAKFKDAMSSVSNSNVPLPMPTEQLSYNTSRDQPQQPPAPIPSSMEYYDPMQIPSNYHTIVLSDMKSCQPIDHSTKQQEVVMMSMNHKSHHTSNTEQQDMLSLDSSTAPDSQPVYQCNQQFDTSEISSHSSNYISL